MVRNRILFFGVFFLFLSFTSFASSPVLLNSQSSSFILPYLMKDNNQNITLYETRREMDTKIKKLHVHFQQNYFGYRVWGAESAVHISFASHKNMNVIHVLKNKNHKIMITGLVYSHLAEDLIKPPSHSYIIHDWQKMIKKIQKEYGSRMSIDKLRNRLVVYIDKNSKAHWAYEINIRMKNRLSEPTFIIDVYTHHVYQKFDKVKMFDCDSPGQVCGGGLGGNPLIGKIIYDGLTEPQHLTKLVMQREDQLKICILKNDYVNIINYLNKGIFVFDCPEKDKTHQVYWNGEFNPINEGYSPANDALYAMTEASNMYLDWVSVPILLDSDRINPIPISTYVNFPHDESFWNGEAVFLGNGGALRYPYTVLDVVTHEASHGFTQQNSNLVGYGEAGGINESFSDCAGAAAYFYTTSTPNWLVGLGMFRNNSPIRFMNDPTKDCYGGVPGNNCSIDNVSQYHDGLDPHYSSGIYNLFYYFLSQASGWDPATAFQLLAYSNRFYWRSTETFKSAACGVILAAIDSTLNLESVINAFKRVGIDTADCPRPPPE